ncbi:molybdenum ABC transporter ATP-binding protein [Marinomonas mediterranea]|uniref:molybdenum ABC transporter ATP-binding protein n=1 Tax=Marinomonas mediterranea TaxID=119864 RepID=UPI00234A7EFE|nr:molybdenum ABC transporter ATP-binding protein [Marinomonas mediterranea]WCN08284.1 molybdenum ABC transporter ATP-binding protein [Marinomonas mediterranea]
MTRQSSIRLSLERSERFQLEVELALKTQGITAVFGESGCGKTTLLRCIAGLDKAVGKVSINGNIWQDEGVCFAPHQRSIGYVFQQANLFPHLTVEGNLNYARKRAKKQIAQEQVDHLIDLTDIRPLLNASTAELSGGEAQRVAIVRALMTEPDILLMDEPLASLDSTRKDSILDYLNRLKRALSIPVLYVTHSLEEVSRIADDVILMEKGRVVQHGAVTDVFSSLTTDKLLGKDASVILEGRITDIEHAWQLADLQFDGGKLKINSVGLEQGQSARARILAKDISVSLSYHTDSSFLNQLQAQIQDMNDGGLQGYVTLKLKMGDSFLLAHITRYSCQRLNLQIGQSVWANIKTVAII